MWGKLFAEEHISLDYLVYEYKNMRSILQLVIHSTQMSRDVSMIDKSLSARPLNPYVTLRGVSEPSRWHCWFCDGLCATNSGDYYSDHYQSNRLAIYASPFSWVIFHIKPACGSHLHWNKTHAVVRKQRLRPKARRCHAEIPSTRTLQAARMAPPQKLGQNYYELKLVRLGGFPESFLYVSPSL